MWWAKEETVNLGKEFVFDAFRSVKRVLGQTPPTDLTLIISQGFGLSFLNHQLWKLYVPN